MRGMQTNQRGAVLVHVAVAIIGLVAVSALTIDAGVKWIARNQAQNAADAGALAGAVALSFDDPNDLSDSGMAKQSALRYALANQVWGESPDVQVSTDITILPECPDLRPDICIKVDVYRNQERRNWLPTYAAELVGVLSQGVRATATAQVRTGNASDCLKPWAVVDRWNEYNGAHTEPDTPDMDFMPDSTFDRYNPPNKSPEPDLYIPPTESDPGTGFNVTTDYGTQYAIKTDAGNTAVSSGWFRAVDLPRIDEANLGGEAYRTNIVSCNGYPVGIAKPETQCPVGSAISTFEEKVRWAAQGCLRVETGNMIGPTIQGVEELFAKDPAARWNDTVNEGHGGVTNSCCTPSPRIVPIAVMDIDAYMAMDPSGSGTSVKIVNIFGFFIEGLGDVDRTTGAIIFDPDNPMDPQNKVIIGRLMTLPGLDLGQSTINQNAAFLRTILLVR